MVNCPLCTKTFRYQSVLDVHMVTHTKEKPHKCPMCPQAFGVESHLKNHTKVVHDGIEQTRNKNHHCTLCSYKCSAKSKLEVHVRKHSAELPFSCQITGCGFKTKYRCHLTQHGRQAHSDKRPFKCPSDGCSYKAKRSATIRVHLRVHSNEKPFSCTVSGCNFTCKSKGNLQSHTSRVHSDEKPFKCSICAFRAKAKSDVTQHQLNHRKIQRFQCQALNCGFASHQRKHLKKHFDRKHRTTEILCTEPRCKFRCGSVALLNVHLKIHKLPILMCPSDSCGYRTKYKRRLLQHISRRHNEFQSPVLVAGSSLSDLKTARTMNILKCSFIGCSFLTKIQQHYDRHVVTHKNEDNRQHVCSFCFSRFSKSSRLQAHVQGHIREKPYRCSFCSYATMYIYQLNNHARKIHQIHVIPSGKNDQVRKCRTCGRNCFSYGESVLHSMSHLQPVVVLEQLKLHVL